VIKALARVPPRGRVSFFQGLSEPTLQGAYSYAEALLFPSLAEGFGWPIIEAQACGCPVVTTDEPPMSEIGGGNAAYLPRLKTGDDVSGWASQGAAVLLGLLGRTDAQRHESMKLGCAWAQRFTAASAIDAYLSIYGRVLASYGITETPLPRNELAQT
jgi:glycosyltransferase involved in cell wall biosynthesis